MIDIKGLNDSQREAVVWQDGPLLVIAGPGSGKTRVLTFRIARLIDDSPKDRFRVLGITYTNKASLEMRNRLDSLLTEGRDRATITTFHSFAAEILRQHGTHIGLKPDFVLLTEDTDRIEVLKDVMKTVSSKNENFSGEVSQLLPTINDLLDNCVRSEEALKWLGKRPYAREIANVYAEYKNNLIQENHLDFASLIVLAVDLLEKKPQITKQIQRIYSYVCVDECQDTNVAQSKFLVHLVPETKPNLFIVADDDQVIYQWHGASPSRLTELRTKYKMKLLELPENFRCQPEVIKIANSLIKNNADRPKDKMPLSAHKIKSGPNHVVLKSFKDFEDEKQWLAQRFKEMTKEERANTAILSRHKKPLVNLMVFLEAKGLPVFFAVRKNEFESAPYRWLHGILRLANSPLDKEQLKRMSKAFLELDGVNIDSKDVIARSAVAQSSLLRAWLEAVESRKELESTTKTMLRDLKAKLLDRLDYLGFVNVAYNWFEAVRKRPITKTEAVFDYFDEEKEIWENLKGEISSHYSLSELSLYNYLQELDLRSKERPAPPNAIRALTIHASKGMEFKHVFLIGLVEDELPSWGAVKKGDDSDEMKEERRNCFVAITRAEESLTLTYSETYFGWSKKPSRFLSEMGIL